jgi:hypothetical protein
MIFPCARVTSIAGNAAMIRRTIGLTIGFCEFAKDAAHWDTHESAQNDCDFFNRGIEIIVPPAGIYVCRNFTVEEFAPNQYVISCEAPFVVRESQGQSVR